MGPPVVRALGAGEEGPILNVVFTNSDRQILLVIPLIAIYIIYILYSTYILHKSLF